MTFVLSICTTRQKSFPRSRRPSPPSQFRLFDVPTMAKSKQAKRSSAGSTPYERPTGAKGSGGSASKNNVFKFNTNVGQHILKNPGVADAIVDKAYLKPT